jgi:hypothetical protein
MECSTESCEKDCEVNEWSDWGPCNAECGGGVRERTRTFTPGTPGGATCPCAEEMKEREYCNNDPCPGTSHIRLNRDFTRVKVPFRI